MKRNKSYLDSSRSRVDQTPLSHGVGGQKQSSAGVIC